MIGTLMRLASDCRAFLLLFAAAPCVLACGNGDEIDPLQCEVAEHLIPLSAETSAPASVRFRDDWGEAPARMKLRVLRGGASRFDLAGCGRDNDARLWELSLGWYQLPEEEPASAQVVFFDRARLDAGARLAGEPHFGAQLLRCWDGGCVAVDRYAFAYHYSANTPDYVTGSADIELLDRAAGRFVATVVAQSESPNAGPPSRIELDLGWDPEALPAAL